MSADRAPARAALVPAEVLLVTVTVVAVAGFARLFSDRDAVVPLLVAAVGGHLVSLVARRLGLGVAATSALGLLALALELSAVLYPHRSVLGLPGGATLAAAGDDLRAAWDLFGDVVAPAPSSRGFLLAASVAIWLAAGLADWAAFRLRATAEAVLPAGALFVFTAILGRGGGGVLLATALAAAVLAFAVAQRTVRATADETWVAGRAGVGGLALARSGALLVVVAALVAGAVVPHAPGADSEALVDWRGDGPDKRVTVSPLVDIRSRLVQQSDTVVFVVEADRPAYWRLTSLDLFDGQLWSSDDSFSKADGELPSTPPDATTRELEQTFRILALDAIWAPAALTPVELQESTTDLIWNGDLATLIVRFQQDDADLQSYRVLSRVPEFQPSDLTAELPSPLPDDLARAVALPDDLPALVTETAADVVAGVGTSPYERALALQDWFRREFTYDLEGVGSGHGEDAMTAFLTDRRGYCEQFAGTFAAMMRTLGVPARVAVGFTPGEVGEDGTTYTVRGRNAHAWPEVWIPGAGWVPFEPTPGRGQPGAQDYTGVEPQQDPGDPLPTPTTTAPSTSTPIGPGSTTPQGPATTRPRVEPPVRAAPALPPPSTGDGGLPLPLRVALVAVGALVGALLVDLAAVALLRARRRRRRRRATTVAARVRGAWDDAVEALARAGTPPSPAETDREFAARAAPAAGPAGTALARLAALVTRATWAPEAAAPEADAVGEADTLAREVRAEADRRLTVRQRLRGLVDPRPELRRLGSG